jgi:hypothetical protein
MISSYLEFINHLSLTTWFFHDKVDLKQQNEDTIYELITSNFLLWCFPPTIQPQIASDMLCVKHAFFNKLVSFFRVKNGQKSHCFLPKGTKINSRK